MPESTYMGKLWKWQLWDTMGPYASKWTRQSKLEWYMGCSKAWAIFFHFRSGWANKTDAWQVVYNLHFNICKTNKTWFKLKTPFLHQFNVQKDTIWGLLTKDCLLHYTQALSYCLKHFCIYWFSGVMFPLFSKIPGNFLVPGNFLAFTFFSKRNKKKMPRKKVTCNAFYQELQSCKFHFCLFFEGHLNLTV